MGEGRGGGRAYVRFLAIEFITFASGYVCVHARRTIHTPKIVYNFLTIEKKLWHHNPNSATWNQNPTSQKCAAAKVVKLHK